MVGVTLRLGVKIASLNQSSDHCANLAPPCFAPKFPMGLGLDISDILDGFYENGVDTADM